MKRIFFLIIAMFVSYQVALAETTISDEELNKIYDTGYYAYHEKDFVVALEYFFAYRLLNKDLWKQNPEYGEKFDKTISSIEEIIYNALKAQGYERRYENKEDKSQVKPPPASSRWLQTWSSEDDSTPSIVKSPSRSRFCLPCSWIYSAMTSSVTFPEDVAK
jgi:hypothetical protein